MRAATTKTNLVQPGVEFIIDFEFRVDKQRFRPLSGQIAAIVFSGGIEF